jgi:CubicO group peptidase (beta-lactamase class C family)
MFPETAVGGKAGAWVVPLARTLREVVMAWDLRRQVALLTVLLLLAVSAYPVSAEVVDPASPGPGVFPEAAWSRWDSPQDAGLSAEQIARLRQRLRGMHTTSMMVVVGGRVAFEFGDVARVSYLASVRKSILSLLYGIYHDRGRIDLDRTLEQMESTITARSPALRSRRPRGT